MTTQCMNLLKKIKKGCQHFRVKEWDCGCSWGCGDCPITFICADCGVRLTGARPFRRKALEGLARFMLPTDTEGK